MSTAPLYNTTGKQTGTAKLPTIFDATVNPTLIAQAVRVYRSNQRQSSAKTLRRAEVNLTKKKLYRQKGTGNARHGAKSAPIFVGGGIAHGPTGQQNFKRTMSKNMRRQALASTLSLKNQHKQISIINDLTKLDIKSKAAQLLLKNFKLEDQKVTIVTDSKNDQINQTWKNLNNVQIVYAPLLNTYQLLNGGHQIIMESALPVIDKTYQAKKNQVRQPKDIAVSAAKDTPSKTTTSTPTKKATAQKTSTKSTAKKK